MMKKCLTTLGLAVCLVFATVISAGAISVESNQNAEDTSLSNMQSMMLTAIFEDSDACQVFDQQGADITTGFIMLHQRDYALGNYQAILDDIGERSLSAAFSIPTIQPRLLIDQTASKVLMLGYTQGLQSGTAFAKVTVTCKIQDSTNKISEALPAVFTNTSSGTQVYGTTPEETITVYYDRGIVRGLSVDYTLATGGTSHWNMTGGVTMGSSLEDIQACYGSNSGATGEDGKVSLSYGFGSDGRKAANPHDVTLMAAFVVGENGAEICALLSGILLDG